jgi:hypothetical protein
MFRVVQDDPVAVELHTHIVTKMGAESAAQQKVTKIPINCYVSKLVDELKRTYGYCLVFQPIVVSN